MLTLKEYMELVDYKITEGSDYYCNVPGLYSLDSWNGDQNGYSFHLVFDPNDNQRVYMVDVCDYKNNRAYRLIDPEIVADKEAWEGVDYVDLESDDDFIQKGLAIKAGEDYDTRVSIPLDLPEDVLFELMKQAHEKDITLNQHMEDIIRVACENVMKNPEAYQHLKKKYKHLAYELMGVITDVEEGNGFDDVCLETIKRVQEELLK